MLAAIINKQAIEERLPHSGRMCLIDSVRHCDEHLIHCLTTTHQNPQNPLRSNGHLSAICAVEYAAQAMALHASLLPQSPLKKQGGYLAQVKNLALHVQHLDTITHDLKIEAKPLMTTAASLMYAFSVSANNQPIANGRAMVIIQAGNTA